MDYLTQKKQHEIFLGGSCNPTTWRQDEAIPLLKNLGITFYNPQVSQWCQELIEQEHLAKENAFLLFYVIDSRTRNVVGIIEAASFAGSSRKLVMVVCPYNGPGHSINGESISDQEYVDLRKSLNLLKDLMEKQNIPIFETIPNAVTCAAKIIYERDMTQYVNKSDNIFSQKINNDLVPLFEDTFNTLDTHKSGTINLNDLCIAYDLIYGEKVAMDDLETTRFHYGGNRSSSVSFIQFCSILERRPSSGKSEYLHDLYLIGEGPEWKENIAKPLLRNHGLSYFIPEDDSEDGYTSLCKSRVLLFVISENSRALTTMTRAAFAIGIKANIILCIQSLRLNSEINGCEKISQPAMHDYNRGRTYLMDLAKRNDIPVSTDIEEAVLLAICKNHHDKSNSFNDNSTFTLLYPDV